MFSNVSAGIYISGKTLPIYMLADTPEGGKKGIV